MGAISVYYEPDSYLMGSMSAQNDPKGIFTETSMAGRSDQPPLFGPLMVRPALWSHSTITELIGPHPLISSFDCSHPSKTFEVSRICVKEQLQSVTHSALYL